MSTTSQTVVPREYEHAKLNSSHGCLLPVLRKFLTDIGPGTRVLDVGCGNGAVAAEIAKSGCEIVGIDLSETGIQHARQTCPSGRFEVLPADENLLQNLGEEPFDFVYSLEVIEHLYSPRGFVQGCFRSTRPGGKFICSTPYHGYAKNLMISLLNGWDKHHNPCHEGEHIKFFSLRTLSDLLKQSGFRDLEFRGAGRAPFLWKSMVLCGLRPGPAL